MTAKRTGLSATQTIAVVRSEPLGLAELQFVRCLLADFAPEWCAELDGICADEATLVLVPESGDDMTGPSFVISREGFGYRLDQVQWDDIRDAGLFSTLADAIASVRQTLTPDDGPVLQSARTLH
jgi:hypothetical protein